MRLGEIRLVAAFVVGRALDIISPPVFGPRQVWGPCDPAEELARAEADIDSWEQPVGEFPLELAEQLRASVPAGGVEPPDSAAGGHPSLLSTSELLKIAIGYATDYLENRSATAGNSAATRDFISALVLRAADFRSQGD